MTHSAKASTQGQGVGGWCSAILAVSYQENEKRKALITFFEEIQARPSSPPPGDIPDLKERATAVQGTALEAETAITQLFRYVASLGKEDSPRFAQVQSEARAYLDQEMLTVLETASKEALDVITKELGKRIEEDNLECQELRAIWEDARAQPSLAEETVANINMRIHQWNERSAKNNAEMQAAQKESCRRGELQLAEFVEDFARIQPYMDLCYTDLCYTDLSNAVKSFRKALSALGSGMNRHGLNIWGGWLKSRNEDLAALLSDILEFCWDAPLDDEEALRGCSELVDRVLAWREKNQGSQVIERAESPPKRSEDPSEVQQGAAFTEDAPLSSDLSKKMRIFLTGCIALWSMEEKEQQNQTESLQLQGALLLSELSLPDDQELVCNLEVLHGLLRVLDEVSAGQGNLAQRTHLYFQLQDLLKQISESRESSPESSPVEQQHADVAGPAATSAVHSPPWIQDVHRLCGWIKEVIIYWTHDQYSPVHRIQNLHDLYHHVQTVLLTHQKMLPSEVQCFLGLASETFLPFEQVDVQNLMSRGHLPEAIIASWMEPLSLAGNGLEQLSIRIMHIQAVLEQLSGAGAESGHQDMAHSPRSSHVDASQENQDMNRAHSPVDVVAAIASPDDWKRIFDLDSCPIEARESRLKALMNQIRHAQSPNERREQLQFLEQAFREEHSPVDRSKELWKAVLRDLDAMILRGLFDGDPCPTLKQILLPPHEIDPSFDDLENCACNALKSMGLLSGSYEAASGGPQFANPFWALVETEFLKNVLAGRFFDRFGNTFLARISCQVRGWDVEEQSSKRQDLLMNGLESLEALIFPSGEPESRLKQVSAPPVVGAAQVPVEVSDLLGNPIEILMEKIERLQRRRLMSPPALIRVYHDVLVALDRIPEESLRQMDLARLLLKLALEHARELLVAEEPDASPNSVGWLVQMTVMGALLRHCHVQEQPRKALTDLLCERSPQSEYLRRFLGDPLNDGKAILNTWDHLAGLVSRPMWQDLHGLFVEECCVALLKISQSLKGWPSCLYSWYRHPTDSARRVLPLIHALEKRCRQNPRLAERVKNVLALPFEVMREADTAAVIHAALPFVFEDRAFARPSLLVVGIEAFKEECVPASSRNGPSHAAQDFGNGGQKGHERVLRKDEQSWEMLLPWGLLYALTHREKRGQDGVVEHWQPGYGAHGTIRRNVDRLCSEFSSFREIWNPLCSSISEDVSSADSDLWSLEITEERLFSEVARRVIRKGGGLSSSEDAADVEEPSIFSQEWFLDRRIAGLTRWVVRQSLKIIAGLGKDQRELSDGQATLTDQLALSSALWWPLLDLCHGDQDNQAIVLEALESSQVIQRAFTHALTSIDPHGDTEYDIDAIRERHPWLPERLFSLRIRSRQGLADEAVSLEECFIEQTAQDLTHRVIDMRILAELDRLARSVGPQARSVVEEVVMEIPQATVSEEGEEDAMGSEVSFDSLDSLELSPRTEGSLSPASQGTE